MTENFVFFFKKRYILSRAVISFKTSEFLVTIFLLKISDFERNNNNLRMY